MPVTDRGWRVRVRVELRRGARWLLTPPEESRRGLTYTEALRLAVEHVRAGRAARLVDPDGDEGAALPRAYAAECSGAGPLFSGGGRTMH